MREADRGESASPPHREIFAVGRGQYENIGDVLLRRPLLDWAREHGRLHVYVGHSPEGYDEGLGLRPEDVVHRSFLSWYRALLAAALKGRAHSLYKPGELQLTLVGMKEHLVMLPAAALVRARGGTVARIGAGARNFAPLPRALMWPSNALSSMTRWRDDRTAAYLGWGPAMPDLGFSGGLPDEDLLRAVEEDVETDAAGSAVDRDLLVVSLRDDTEVAPRPYPDARWFEGVRAAADRLGLRIAVVTQISVDQERSERLARDLGAESVTGWPEARGHREQEERLRAVYRRARAVASDRLHVVIAAYTEGAAPIGLLMDDDDKIERHFATVGIHGLTLNAAGREAGEIAEHIVTYTSRRREALERLVEIRRRLDAVRTELGARLSGPGRALTPPALIGDRPRVFHVGRAGDIPGGMAQVVEAYLSYAWDDAEMALIESRGDPHDHLAALRRYLSARRRIIRLARSRGRSVVVVHLSERGSFVREGRLAKLAARLGLPVIAHLHGSEFAAYERANRATVTSVLSVCAHVVTLSDESTAIAAAHVGPDRVTLVPNAVLPGSPGAKARTVVFGGAVSFRKGVDVLRAAWSRLAPDFPGWMLQVAGPVRDGELAEPDILSARMLGSVPHRTLMELLDTAAIAVLPSRDEAMPMFLLEAMARRACAVSTAVGGIPRLLDDGSGVIVAPGDADHLERELRSLMTDAARRESIADHGYGTFLASYSAEAVYPRLLRIWLAPLGGAGVDPPGATSADAIGAAV